MATALLVRVRATVTTTLASCDAQLPGKAAAPSHVPSCVTVPLTNGNKHRVNTTTEELQQHCAAREIVVVTPPGRLAVWV